MNREVWVFGADRTIPEFNSTVRQKILQFTESWNSHGSLISPEIEVLEKRFLKVTSNYNSGAVSGCSKDSLFRFIQDLGNAIKIDFLNRGVVFVKDNAGQVASFPLNELEQSIADRSLVEIYDLSIKNENEFSEKWCKKYLDSWISKFP